MKTRAALLSLLYVTAMTVALTAFRAESPRPAISSTSKVTTLSALDSAPRVFLAVVSLL